MQWRCLTHLVVRLQGRLDVAGIFDLVTHVDVAMDFSDEADL